MDVFSQKLRACCTMFDPADYVDGVDPIVKAAREAKENTLLELIDCVNSMGVALFTESSLREVFRMVAVNLFREMAPSDRSAARDMALSVGGVVGVADEEDEPRLNPLFPVHQLFVYELFMKVIGHKDLDKKRVRKCLSNSYILRLFELFASEDPRERDIVKGAIHKLYVQITAIRMVIRRCIQNFFFRFAFEAAGARDDVSLPHAYGLSEILELYGSVVTGLSVPLKDEHKQFLISSLLPLHRSDRLGHYSAQLTFCLCLFIKKDATLIVDIIQGLLKFWSKASASKETTMLIELNEILMALCTDSCKSFPEEVNLKPIIEPLLKKVVACAESSHFQVAERALYLCNSSVMAHIIQKEPSLCLPIIIPPLLRSTLQHWNGTVHLLAMSLLRLFLNSFPEVFHQHFMAALASTLPEEFAPYLDIPSSPQEMHAKWFSIMHMIMIEIPAHLSNIEPPPLPLDVQVDMNSGSNLLPLSEKEQALSSQQRETVDKLRIRIWQGIKLCPEERLREGAKETWSAFESEWVAMGICDQSGICDAPILEYFQEGDDGIGERHGGGGRADNFRGVFEHQGT